MGPPNLDGKRQEIVAEVGIVALVDRNVPASMRDKPGVGSVWTWTAIDSDSKLMVSWYVGDRDAECAGRFMKDLASRFGQPGATDDRRARRV